MHSLILLCRFLLLSLFVTSRSSLVPALAHHCSSHYTVSHGVSWISMLTVSKSLTVDQIALLFHFHEWKSWLTTQHTENSKIMAAGSITSWQIDGETMETVRNFIFLGSKITADGDCSHEIKRCLLLGRKAMTNLDNILKSRDITLPTKV